MTDPFAAPAIVPSNFPTVASLRGRLVLIEPLSQRTVPNNMGGPGAMQEQVTANVSVVDGLGPVPQMKGNPAQPTGLMIDGPTWNGMWIQSEVVVKQLADALRGRTKVLARIDVPNPNMAPGKGNAYGLIDATQSEADKQTARQFLAGQMVGAASAPAAPHTPIPVAGGQPAPPYQASPVYQAQPQYAPQPVPAQAPPAAQPLPQPGSAPAGVNPFA